MQMNINNDLIIKTIVLWFLVLHVIKITRADRPEFITTELRIRNGMSGLKRPGMIYHCRALTGSRLDYGWRRAAKPGMGHSFNIIVEGGRKLEEEIHLCYFRSVMGTADVKIRMTAIEAEMCVKNAACGVHVATREGIVFEGKEWDFSERYPRLIPLRYVEATWKPWPPRSRPAITQSIPIL